MRVEITDVLLRIAEKFIAKADKKRYDKYLLYKKYYEKFNKTPENKLDKLYDEEPEIFYMLEEYDYQNPKDIKHEPPKVNIIILDDLLGSDAFTKKTKSVLTKNSKNNSRKKHKRILAQDGVGW